MIKQNGKKILPKEAAIQTVLSRLMAIGMYGDECEMIEGMTDFEFDLFMREYTAIYNKISSKLGADEVDSDTLLGNFIRRIKDCEQNTE